jgi:hypothetical protein
MESNIVKTLVFLVVLCSSFSTACGYNIPMLSVCSSVSPCMRELQQIRSELAWQRTAKGFNILTGRKI